MARISDEIRRKVVAMYEQGENVGSIALMHSISGSAVCKFAKEAGLARKPGVRRLDKAIEVCIVADYQSGLEVVAIASKYNIDASTIYDVLKRNNVDAQRAKQCKSNLRAFAKPSNGYTECQRYWAGFLLADGCICIPKQGNPMLILGLQDKDKVHMESFAKFLESTHKLRWNKSSGQWLLHVRGSHWVEDLAPFGVTPQKTYTTQVPDEFKSDRDFWRGLIDGDGCVRWHKSNVRGKMIYVAQLNICGSLDVCESFGELVKFHAPSATRTIRRDAPNCWRMAVHGKAIVPLLQWLYEYPKVALDRKKDAALQICKAYETGANQLSLKL